MAYLLGKSLKSEGENKVVGGATCLYRSYIFNNHYFRSIQIRIPNLVQNQSI